MNEQSYDTRKSQVAAPSPLMSGATTLKEVNIQHHLEKKHKPKL